MFGKKKKSEINQNEYMNTAASKDPLGQRKVWLVGRNAPCDLIYNDQSVSRKHALIVSTGKGFYLSDLHSANGTFVNGYRLYGETRIYEEDELMFGSVRIRFSEDQLYYPNRR